MSGYTTAELVGRLLEISEDRFQNEHTRRWAKYAAWGQPRYSIAPPDLSDDAIHTALLVAAACRHNRPHLTDDPGKLRALLDAEPAGEC